MGSFGYNLGTIWDDLTRDQTDPNFPPLKFSINNGVSDMKITLRLELDGKVEEFEEGKTYGWDSLLNELFQAIQQETEEEETK